MQRPVTKWYQQLQHYTFKTHSASFSARHHVSSRNRFRLFPKQTITQPIAATMSSSAKDKRNRKQSWKTNGTPEIIFGTSLVILLSLDQYLQKRQMQQRHDNLLSLQRIIESDTAQQKHDEEHDDEFQHRKSNQSKTLYQCRITRIPKYFDGTKSLTNVKVGDVVSIHEEYVGPDKMYHLCSVNINTNNDHGEIGKDHTNTMIAGNSESQKLLGWFPITCLEIIQNV